MINSKQKGLLKSNLDKYNLKHKTKYDIQEYFDYLDQYNKLHGGMCGGGPLQTIANVYRKKFCNGKSRPLKNGENHPGCYNFAGPGTRIDLPEVLNTKPFNLTDAVAKQHDIDYEDAFKLPPNEKKKAIRRADQKMIDSLNALGKDADKIAKIAIGSKIKIEDSGKLGKKIIEKTVGKDYVGNKSTDIQQPTDNVKSEKINESKPINKTGGKYKKHVRI